MWHIVDGSAITMCSHLMVLKKYISKVSIASDLMTKNAPSYRKLMSSMTIITKGTIIS